MQWQSFYVPWSNDILGVSQFPNGVFHSISQVLETNRVYSAFYSICAKGACESWVIYTLYKCWKVFPFFFFKEKAALPGAMQLENVTQNIRFKPQQQFVCTIYNYDCNYNYK